MSAKHHAGKFGTILNINKSVVNKNFEHYGGMNYVVWAWKVTVVSVNKKFILTCYADSF